MDNKQFNVNGITYEQLFKAIDLLLTEEYGTATVTAFRFVPEKGLILLWNSRKEEDRKALIPLKDPHLITDLLWQWLQTEEALECLNHLDGWDANADHDGSNDLGWRVYCEDWGHVDNDFYAVGAIKPVWCWHGK